MSASDPWSVVGLLRRYEFRFASESELQRGVAEVLVRNRIEFERERVLSDRDRIDFLLAAGIGIEVKIAGGVNDLLRQCSRYLARPEIVALVVVAGGSRLASRVPPTLNGKPLAVVNVRATL